MNSISPKVSVIIPFFNVEDVIDQTIESLLKQTQENVEFIFINDGSTDGTSESILKYQEKNASIKLFDLGSNQGVSFARNIGVQVAKGDYIFFMDSDDLLPENSLETLYCTALQKEADLVTGVFASYTDGVVNSADMFKQFPRLGEQGEKHIHEFPELFYLIYCWGKLFKRELIKNISFPEDIRNYFEDQPFTVSAYLNARKIYTIPNVIYYHRKRSGNSKSLTQLINLNIEQHLKDLINAMTLSISYITVAKQGEEQSKLITAYLNRALLWNVWHTISLALSTRNPRIIKFCFNNLEDWINTIDDNVVLETNSFRVILQEVSKQAQTLDPISLDSLLSLLRCTKNKMELASKQQKNTINTNKIKLKDGTHINVFANDFIGKIIEETNTYYEIEELTSFQQYLPRNGVVYDIGTNIGNHTLYFSKYLTPKKIYSFEPIPAVCEVLNRNLQDNGITNVELIKAAASNKNTKGTMNINRGNIGGSQLNYNDNGEIQVVKIDDLPLQEPDFVKIDVEDFELDVIEGMEKTLLKSHPTLWIEIRDKNLAKVNYKLMQLGYRICEQLPSKYDYSNYIYK